MKTPNSVSSKPGTGHWELVVHTEQSGSLVSRGLADIEKKQSAHRPDTRVDAEKLFQDAVDAWKRKDAEAAARYATSAATRGSAAAQALLGEVHSLREDGLRNYVLAYTWYSVALKNSQSVTSPRNWVASMLTPAQVAEADQFAYDRHLEIARLVAKRRLILAEALERKADRKPEKAEHLRDSARRVRLGASWAMRNYLPKLSPEQASQMSSKEKQNWHAARLLTALSLGESEGAARAAPMTPNTIEAPDRQAVEQIDVWAQFERGEAAASAGDHVQAVKWWRLSAERGCAEAQHQLGRAFSEGKGVSKDHVKACMWLTLSWRSKEKPRVFFSPSSDEIRKTIERYMTPVQIAEAQVLVREWAAARVA